LQRLHATIGPRHARGLARAAPLLADLCVVLVDRKRRPVFAALAALAHLRRLVVRCNNTAARPLSPHDLAALRCLRGLRRLTITAAGVSPGPEVLLDEDFGSLLAALPHLVSLKVCEGGEDKGTLTGAALRAVVDNYRKLAELELSGLYVVHA
jgi:hypothetical protein